MKNIHKKYLSTRFVEIHAWARIKKSNAFLITQALAKVPKYQLLCSEIENNKTSACILVFSNRKQKYKCLYLVFTKTKKIIEPVFWYWQIKNKWTSSTCFWCLQMENKYTSSWIWCLPIEKINKYLYLAVYK